MEQAADDLKAFERRMIEIIHSLQPSIWRWRFILAVLICITIFSLYTLLIDETITELTSWTHILIKTHFYFTLSFVVLVFSFLFGIHRKIFSSSIIISRFRYVLQDYNMSCDGDGRLILRPRPT